MSESEKKAFMAALEDIGGKEIMNFMQQLINTENSREYNVILFIHKPYRSGAIASISFSNNHCLSNDDGFPSIDWEQFRLMGNAGQVKELDAILAAVGSFVSATEKVHDDIIEFGNKLKDLRLEIISKH